MKTYLIFFGSSDGFEFEVFDINATNFTEAKTNLKQFDQLDPKYLIPNDINNAPVYGKYTFSYDGKVFSLLKIYQCAQSFVSSRIEGSNIGVALMSEKNIELCKDNLDFLEQIHNDFKSRVLNNGKFKERIFETASFELYNIYKERIISQFSYEKINLSTDNVYPAVAFALKSLNDDFISKLKQYSNKFARVYICKDQNFIENSLKTKTFKFYIENENEIIEHSKYTELLNEHKKGLNNPKTTIKSSKNNDRPKVIYEEIDSLKEDITELKNKLKDAKKEIDDQYSTIKFARVIIISCLIGLVTFIILYFYREETTNTVMKEVKVKIVVNPLKDIINNKDTSKAKELSENLDKYVKMFRKTKFEKLQKDSSYQILTNKIIIQ
jgi:hypothetical protein